MAFSEDESSLHDVTNNIESSSHHSQRLDHDSFHSNDTTTYVAKLLGNKNSTEKQLAGLNLDYEEEKSWNKMDSVHSKASTVQSAFLESANSSFDFNDSMASFASFGSFGGSDSDLGASSSSLNEHRASFTLLQEETAGTASTLPRRNLLARTSSLRMKQGPSFRRSSLTLIDEKKDSL